MGMLKRLSDYDKESLSLSMFALDVLLQANSVGGAPQTDEAAKICGQAAGKGATGQGQLSHKMQLWRVVSMPCLSLLLAMMESISSTRTLKCNCLQERYAH